MTYIPHQTRVRLMNDYSSMGKGFPGYGARGRTGTQVKDAVWVNFECGACLDVPLAHLEIILEPTAPRTEGMNKLQAAIVELLEIGTMARDIRTKIAAVLKDKTILGKVRVKLNVRREAQRREAAESRNMTVDIVSCVRRLEECGLVTIARAVCPGTVPDYARVRALIDNLVTTGRLVLVSEDRWRLVEPQT